MSWLIYCVPAKALLMLSAEDRKDLLERQAKYLIKKAKAERELDEMLDRKK